MDERGTGCDRGRAPFDAHAARHAQRRRIQSRRQRESLAQFRHSYFRTFLQKSVPRPTLHSIGHVLCALTSLTRWLDYLNNILPFTAVKIAQ